MPYQGSKLPVQPTCEHEKWLESWGGPAGQKNGHALSLGEPR